jgi:hypothetical protein
MQASSPERSRLAVGLVLIVIGALFLIAQVVEIDVGDAGWPLLVIVPGIALLVVGLLVGGQPGVGLSIAGSITTMVGVVLFYQNLTGLYETWAYAWALVAPGGVGLGMLLSGIAQGDRELATEGARTALVGVGLFLGFGIFFEGVVGLSGGGGLFAEPFVAAALVVIGIVVMIWGIVTRGRGEA